MQIAAATTGEMCEPGAGSSGNDRILRSAGADDALTVPKASDMCNHVSERTLSRTTLEDTSLAAYHGPRRRRPRWPLHRCLIPPSSHFSLPYVPTVCALSKVLECSVNPTSAPEDWVFSGSFATFNANTVIS